MILYTYVALRAAQRAFRERKQSQLAELQVRVQQYEQGEIERNVALQNIAKRLKEENDKLRQENAQLNEKLSAAEEERDSLRELSRKRWREESGPPTPSYGLEMPTRKRQRPRTDTMDSFASHNVPSPYYSPSSIASSPASNDHTSFSPMPSLPPPRESSGMPMFPQGSSLSNIFDFISSGKTNIFEPGGGLDTFSCGFCSDSTPCVCRELALQQVGERLGMSTAPPFKVEHAGNTQVVELHLGNTHISSQQSSILENLPAYQPPVPLRRRGGPRTTVAPIFPISQQPQLPASSSPTQDPSCTGDPSNCPACADDAFGRAFCAAISKTVASSSRCSSCPCGSEGGCNHTVNNNNSNGPCCGNPASCSRARENAAQSSSPARSPLALPDMGIVGQTSSSSFDTQMGTIPCHDAWRQIKSHPNVTFADLDLLAEVVARRAKCTGPRVEIFPAPGSITPERGISPLTLPTSFTPQQHLQHQQMGMTMSMSTGTGTGIQQPMMHTQDHRHLELLTDRARGGAPSPPLQLVPQDILMQCSRQRVREVHADAVQDALRILDAKFSLP